MRSSEPAIPPPVDLFEPLSSLLDRAVSVASQFGVGVAVGLLADRSMSRLGLRWTWAMLVLAVLLLVHPALGTPTIAGETAALCAAVRGRNRHLQELMAGGDLADVAAARLGPLGAIRAMGRKLGLRRGAPAGHAVVRDGRMIVGRVRSGATRTIPFGADRGGRHTLIVGATGSGKTVTETWVVCRAIEVGLAAVVVDPKGDARMREHLREAAHEAQRRFVEWTPEGPSVYNPLGCGSASEIADKALAGEHFTEPHYQRQAQRYLGHAVRALRGAGAQISLRTLVAHLEPAQLDVLTRCLPEPEAKATQRYLDSLTPRQQAELSGVRDRLAILVESDVGPWLDPDASAAHSFDLLGAIRERAVVYFALQADSWPLLARMLGVAIMQDLRAVMATLQRSPVAAVVAIDEFAAISAEQVVHLFGRARSAGINLLLGTQELSDLRTRGDGKLQDQVLGNLSTLIAHRQVVPSSADLIARLAGRRGAWRTSHASDGRWTRTRTTVPLLAPEDVCALAPGHAAVVELGGTEPAQVVEVCSSLRRRDRPTRNVKRQRGDSQ